jgi:LCP family protein required for cell wall assembly
VSDLRPRPHRVRAAIRHGRVKQSNPFVTVLKFLSAGLAVVLVSGAAVAGISLTQITNNIKTVTLVGETQGPPPALGDFEGGFNVLLVGSDTRLGQGEKGPDGARNDVNILLHVSQDQTNAVAVSIPRDLIVDVPQCPREDGKGSYGARSGTPINTSLGTGGLPCVVLTVEKLTGLSIPFAGVITFDGVTNVSTAVGGVPVCVNGRFHDTYTGFTLPKAGTYNLEGNAALMFLRSRHGVGDGSDLGRISSQQVFLSSLVRTVKSNSTLTDFGKMFNIATVASESMTLSDSLKNINTMVSMAQVLKKLSLDRIMFVQYPGATGATGAFAGKVLPITSLANALFAKIKADEPFSLEAGKTGRGSVADPNAPADAAAAAPTTAPTGDPTTAATGGPDAAAQVLDGVLGQSAADYTCSKVNN